MSATLRFLALAFVACILASAAPPQRPVFEIRRVLDGLSPDSEPMVLLHQAKDGQPIKEILNVGKTPVLDQSVVKAAKVVADEISGKPQVEVIFTEEDRTRFAEATRANADKRLAILVEGKVILAPIIRTEIRDGRALIAGDFTQEEAKELADKINEAVRTSEKNKLKPWTYGPYDQLRELRPIEKPPFK